MYVRMFACTHIPSLSMCTSCACASGRFPCNRHVLHRTFLTRTVPYFYKLSKGEWQLAPIAFVQTPQVLGCLFVRACMCIAHACLCCCTNHDAWTHPGLPTRCSGSEMSRAAIL